MLFVQSGWVGVVQNDRTLPSMLKAFAESEM